MKGYRDPISQILSIFVTGMGFLFFAMVILPAFTGIQLIKIGTMNMEGESNESALNERVDCFQLEKDYEKMKEDYEPMQEELTECRMECESISWFMVLLLMVISGVITYSAIDKFIIIPLRTDLFNTKLELRNEKVKRK